MSQRGFFWERYGWGLLFAGGYLLAAAALAAVYLTDRHEYSMPLLILLHASYPAYWILAGPLHFLMATINRLPHGELILLANIIFSTAALYFGMGQALGWLVRKIRMKNGKPKG